MGRYLGWTLAFTSQALTGWAALSACSGAQPEQTAAAQPKSTAQAAKSEPAFSRRPEAAPADLPGAKDPSHVHLNLQNLVHLADVDQGGLFLDFGTPARNKYTVGDWKTGWGKDGVAGGATYTNVAGSSGRVYLPLRAGEDSLLRIRLKPIGTGTLQIYLNNQALPSIKLDKGSDFAEYDVPLPAAHARAGENNLLLRFGGVKKVGDDELAAAVDWIRVLPAAAAGAAVAPASSYAELVKDVVVGGQKRKALALPAKTTLSYYVDVPKAAKLSVRVGALESKAAAAPGPRALIRVTPNGGKPRDLWSGALTGSWQEQQLALDSYAGSVVKLELQVDGSGAGAFSSPTIVTPQSNVAKAKSQAKNVVVLLIDTLRADRLRAYTKGSRVKTPVLDSIAADGAVFENSQSPENWTKPSVASILTGLYPMTHRTKQGDSALSEKALMVSEVYKQHGFATGTFLANGYVSDKFGFKQGWDYYTNYIREGKPTKAERVFRDAGDWVEKNKDKRFFLYIQTIDPHVPYDPPSEFLKMYQTEPYAGSVKPRQTPDLLEKAKRVPPKVTFDERDRAYLENLYDAEISYHDHYLGVFIERLKKLGLYEDMVFVVTSDHGEEFYEHGSYGHGHSVYQELLHVPFIVRWPGVVSPQRQTATVGTLDISPTVLTASGIAVPEVMEGTDRVPQLLGALPSMPAVAFSDFLDDRRVIRAGRWKLILRGLNATFFDLKTDPGEKVELDLQSNPIALRYCRILLGQFIGARDRGDWLSAEQKGASVELSGEAAEMDEHTKAGLKALGYAN